jgi:dTDP-4-dehydrorhamnose 3,5-epimerase
MTWKIAGLIKDEQSITSDWNLAGQELIHMVKLREVKHVPKHNGYLTEIYRKDWNLDGEPIGQVFQIKMNPGAISGWHVHETTTDQIFVNYGLIKVVLYDPRQDSPTYKMINEFVVGTVRPMMIVVPPKVFHAVQNVHDGESLLLNIVDVAYNYENPDHWRAPLNHSEIPYRF